MRTSRWRLPRRLQLLAMTAYSNSAKIDDIAHPVVAGIARMQVIAAVVDRQHARRMFGIAHALVEVDNGIERAAVPDPGIHRLPHRLARRRPGTDQEGLVLERRQRAAEDLNAARMRPQRHLLQPGDHLLGGDLLLGLGPAVAQIVGSQHHDRMRHARLRQHVAIEATQAAVAADVVQDAVAAEALVHHAHRAAAARDEPPRKLVGPAAERVVRGDVAHRSASRPAPRCRRCPRGASTSMPLTKYQSSVMPADRHHRLGGEIAGR